MPCEDCLSRRDFLARSAMVVAGVAAIAAGCGDGQIGPDAITAPTGTFTLQVASVPELATVGQLVVVPSVSQFFAIKRTGATTFEAISMICTHQGCLTALQSNAFVCPCHGARYDAEGKVTQQPQQTTGTATALPQLATSYDAGTGVLTISS